MDFGDHYIATLSYCDFFLSPSGQEDYSINLENQSITIDNTAIDSITTRYLLLNLSIIDDNIALEGTESILFEFSDEESQVRLGEHSTTTVLITDGDGEYTQFYGLWL